MKNQFLLIIFLFTAQALYSQDISKLDDSLANDRLKDLINYKVTSVSKKVEVLTQVPANIYVITKEDIENSSALSFQDILRERVPGFWMASNDYYENDLYIRDIDVKSVMILLDGTPVKNFMPNRLIESNFEIPLVAIERIEIIRGSAGSIYGANATSGLINIITKCGYKKEDIIGEVRAGFPGHYHLLAFGNKKINKKSGLSIFFKYKDFGGYPQNFIKDYNKKKTDEFNSTNRLNVRTSSLGANYLLENKKFSVKSCLFAGISSEQDYTLNKDFDDARVNESGQIENIINNTDPKFYYNKRITANTNLAYNFNLHNSLSFKIAGNSEDVFYNLSKGYRSQNYIVDGELQYNCMLYDNYISIGCNVRQISFQVYGSDDALYFKKTNEINYLDGYFIQNKKSFFDENLKVYAGLRLERNTLCNNKYSFSPSLKFITEPNSYLTFWAGFSQSSTSPAYSMLNMEYTYLKVQSDGFNDSIGGIANFSSIIPAISRSFDVALRVKINYSLYFESTFFYMFLSDGISTSREKKPTRFNSYTDNIVFAYDYGNYLKGYNKGVESILRYKPSDDLKIEFSHSWFSYYREYIHSANKSFHNSFPIIPENVFRLNLFKSFNYGFRIQANTIFATSYYNKYNNINNSYDGSTNSFLPIWEENTDGSIEFINDNRIIFDIRISKQFNDLVDVYIYGIDFLRKYGVESANQLLTSYPRTAGQIFGFGIKFLKIPN